MWQRLILFAEINVMQKSEFIEERKLADLAKKCRMAAGKTRAAAARDMGIKHPSIHHAEESPEMGYHSLRIRLIETYSKLRFY